MQEVFQADTSQALPPPALVVDLDGTLIRTDLLWESVLPAVRANPLVLFLLPLWLLRGRAYLKDQLVRRVHLDVVTLPYRDDVLQQIALARGNGRRVILATASHRKLAEQVATHLECFDSVLATGAGINLKGAIKAREIEAHLGGQNFDYIGDSTSDIPVWQRCRQPIVVASSKTLVAAASRGETPAVVLREPRIRMRTVVKMLRIHQWLKNMLVFVPLVAAHDFTLDKIAAAITAFVAFGLCASSVYVLNDLFDLEADRKHERKRHRALASGAIPIRYGLAAIPVLLAASLALTLTLPPLFLATMVAYYVSTMVYSWWAKRRVIVDVIMLAGLYTLRLLAGCAATGIAPSFWLLALSDFIFLSLALVKRYSELVRLVEAGAGTAPGRDYVISDMAVLLAMGVASGFCSVLVMAMYINSPDVLAHYTEPRGLWAICPLLLFWLARLWIKCHRGEVHDDPVVFAATDKPSLVIGGILMLSLVGANW